MKLLKLSPLLWGGPEVWNRIIKLDQKLITSSWDHPMWSGLIDNQQHYQIFYFPSDVNTVLGFSLWQQVSSDDPAHLLKIAVDYPSQRQGHGKHLLQQAIDQLHGSGTSKFYLEVAVTNSSAIATYKKCGFNKLRELSHFYPDGGDALSMGLDLGN